MCTVFWTGEAGTRESGTAGQNRNYWGRLALGRVNREHEVNYYFVAVKVDSDLPLLLRLGPSEDV